MQFKLCTALLVACMTVVVSASPLPVVLPPLDVESREHDVREQNAVIPRDAAGSRASLFVDPSIILGTLSTGAGSRRMWNL